MNVGTPDLVHVLTLRVLDYMLMTNYSKGHGWEQVILFFNFGNFVALEWVKICTANQFSERELLG